MVPGRFHDPAAQTLPALPSRAREERPVAGNHAATLEISPGIWWTAQGISSAKWLFGAMKMGMDSKTWLRRITEQQNLNITYLYRSNKETIQRLAKLTIHFGTYNTHQDRIYSPTLYLLRPTLYQLLLSVSDIWPWASLSPCPHGAYVLKTGVRPERDNNI